MATFGSYSLTELTALRGELQTLASEHPTLREAGQIWLSRLYHEFAESLPLARLFATVPYGFLPEREKAFARGIATENNVLSELTEDTIVVTLVATRGLRPEWNDPQNSRHHLAIPMLSASVIRPIPLVGRVLSGTMTGIPWLTKQKTLMLLESMGQISQLIYVRDARSARSGNDHRLILAQDFVEAHGIRTVLALGGSYLNQTCLALVLFTQELLTEEQVSKFTTLLSSIKTPTMSVVMDCKIL